MNIPWLASAYGFEINKALTFLYPCVIILSEMLSASADKRNVSFPDLFGALQSGINIIKRRGNPLGLSFSFFGLFKKGVKRGRKRKMFPPFINNRIIFYEQKMRSVQKRIQKRSDKIPFQHQDPQEAAYQSSTQKDRGEQALGVLQMS